MVHLNICFAPLSKMNRSQALHFIDQVINDFNRMIDVQRIKVIYSNF